MPSFNHPNYAEMVYLRSFQDWTLRDIAVKFGVSHQRVQQIIGTDAELDYHPVVTCQACGLPARRGFAYKNAFGAYFHWRHKPLSLAELKLLRALDKNAHREWIIERIHDWNALHGRPPGAADWNPAILGPSTKGPDFNEALHADARERYEEDFWPNVTTVQKYFVSWKRALAAAGYKPNPSGRAGARPERAHLYRRATT
jgi:hypothetical protein